jgi:inosine/xanthosine triphosphate pyrophosphatase family protein
MKTIELKYPLNSQIYFFEDNKIQKRTIKEVEIKIEYKENSLTGEEHISKKILYTFRKTDYPVIKDESEIFPSLQKLMKYLEKNIEEK